MDKATMWDMLIEIGLTEETLQIVTSINGYSEEVMCDILYAHTGLRAFEQVEGGW